MQTVHIYVETENTSPRSTSRMAGYVLEYKKQSGEMKTAEDFSQKIGTYHRAILLAMEDALKRMNRPCELHIHTQDEYVLNSIDKYLHIWAANGWRNKKGDLVKNHFEWSRLWRLLQGHLIVTEAGMHSRYSNMVTQMREKMREIQEVPE